MGNQRVSIPPRAALTEIPRRHISVFVKQEWEDPVWTFAADLEPLTLSERSIGSDSNAKFRYRFGLIRREGKDTFFRWNPAKVQDVYVCIRVTNVAEREDYVLWVGVIPSDEIQWYGSKIVAGGNNHPAGVQIFNAFGLEYILERRVMDTAPAQPPNVAGDDFETLLLNDVPSFNEQPKIGSKLIGNRTNLFVKNTNDSYPNDTFHAFSKDGAIWQALDILGTLLIFSDRYDHTQEPHYEITAPAPLFGFLLTWQLFHDPKQRTVLGSIRAIISPQNGLGARIAWTIGADGLPTTGKVYIEVYTLIGDDLVLSDRTLPKNAQTATDDTLGTDLRNKTTTVSFDSKKKFDKIVVRGERIRMCFSAALNADMIELAKEMNIAELFPGWTPSQENEFNTIPHEESAKRLLPKYDRVYQRFYLGNNSVPGIPWNWETLGINDTKFWLHPSVFTSSLVTINSRNTDFADMTAKLLDRLPFANPAEVIFEALIPGLDKPAVWVRAMDTSEDPAVPAVPETWFNVVDPPVPGAAMDEDSLTPVNDHTANLSMIDRDLAINIKFRKGAQVLGLNRMTEDEVGSGGESPQYDHDYMVATLNVAMDQRLEAVHEPNPALDQAFSQRTKVIQVADAHFWVICPTTIVGLTDTGKLKAYSGPQVVRDDMPRLLDKLIMARAWYGVDRAIVTRKRAGIEGEMEIGTYVTSVVTELGRQDVESVVSERNFNFEDATTEIKTNVYALSLEQ